MRLLLACCLLALGVLAGCDAVGDSAESGTARLTVRLTDAPFPFDLAASANVTITRIELLAAEADTTASDSTDADAPEGDRIVLFDAATDGGAYAFNLLDLRDGVTAMLVDSLAIPTDRAYRQIRVYVGDDASVVFTDGTEYGLKLPSVAQQGIRINLPAYSAEGGEDIDLLLDFDVEKSFVTRGNPGSPAFKGFLFKPVLEVEDFDVRDGDPDVDPED